MKFVPEEVQNSHIVSAILNSTQQPGRVLLTSFRQGDFVQMASEKSFNYDSRLWLLSRHIILGHTMLKTPKW